VSAHHLSDYFALNRRYSRSINLERDLADPSSLKGYVITERAAHALKQIISGMAGAHSAHAWMLTGVYGTGKSAFGHFLSSLCSSRTQELRKNAETILEHSRVEREVIKLFNDGIAEGGLFRAVVTAQREPVSHTLLRALRSGVISFWHPRTKVYANFIRQIDIIQKRAAKGRIDASEILLLLKEIADASKTNLILIIDEFGKCLEYAAQNRDVGDLFLLQQISESFNESGCQIYLLGLLHQGFSEYSYTLGTVERNEWAKIQGRFEEIPFTESAHQMAQLIGQVIQHDSTKKFDAIINRQATAWHSRLSKLLEVKELTSQIFAEAYPLHPVATLALPQLCIRYAQNDRSLFTFLTSAEPYSLRTFLDEASFSKDDIQLLKIDRLYDYFIDTAGIGMASRPNFQKWTEVKGLIDDHRNGDPIRLKALKAIGILNLASTTGFLKASRQLVTLALCDKPDDQAAQHAWGQVISDLIKRGVVVHRSQIDELRIWEGSDFEIETILAQSIEQQRSSLATLLSNSRPLHPLVVQRHSYQTGTLRYFERRYIDSHDDLVNVVRECKESDGLICYWVDEAPPALVPAETADHKPIVLIQVGNIKTLRLRALELVSLKNIQANAAELQTDGVARREVRHRLIQSQSLLDESFSQVFEAGNTIKVWIAGKSEFLDLRKGLNARLSKLCDEVYKKGPTLWNELINRQELTSQGAKACRKVIAAMIEHPELEHLGLKGAGPEVSIYSSVLARTGIHKRVEGAYSFHPPDDIRVKDVWEAIERFCLEARTAPITLNHLYDRLQRPPYGVKSGLIPILFASVIMWRADDVSIYKDGAFIPVLGAEHFELLVKHPSRFSVKHYEVSGAYAQVFKQVEDILVSGIRMPQGIRNKTLLGIISPLLQFVRKLPYYSQKTKKLSARAQSVRQVLLEAHEPDKLLFDLLPSACALNPVAEWVESSDSPRKLRVRLTSALKELRESYEILLSRSRDYIYEAFGVRQDKEHLREDLRSRASYLQGRSIEPILTRFVFAATDDLTDEQQWLQGLVMIIADKPSESWTDSDAEAFELKLSDIARRFKHLEAIIRDNNALWATRAEARRVSIVRTDGTELHDIAWIDEDHRETLENKADEIIQSLDFGKSEQRAVLVA
jgi:hypothetical protein